MQPESGAGVFLRFVQAAPVAGYGPMKTFGWNATEILVQDPDALAEQLADSPFKIVGSPMNLSSNENIRAMQVVGPANEVLYLTRIPPGGAAPTWVRPRASWTEPLSWCWVVPICRACVTSTKTCWPCP